MKSTACIPVALAFAAPGIAAAQSLKDQIVGPWKLAALYNEDKGGKRVPYGDNPVGLVIYDRSGYVMQYLSRPNVPKFAVANLLRWIASSYPNRAGTTEKRTYKVAGAELTAVNPTAASGGR